MIMAVAQHLAAVGKLELLDVLEITGPAPDPNAASKAKVEQLFASLSVRKEVMLPTGGPLLLVDDTYRSGWTMTVAAALLKEAGASSVSPLVIHQLP
jgi:ATP-dependent DNA helicase RecQ